MVIQRYLYTGQPSPEFPRWLRFRNYAQSLDGSLLVLPRFLDVIHVRSGQTILLLATMEVEVAEE